MYSDDDLWRLEFVARAKQLGFTLSEIVDLFGPDDTRSPGEVLDAAHAKLTDVEEQVDVLLARRCRLRRLVEVCRHGDDAACVALHIGASA